MSIFAEIRAKETPEERARIERWRALTPDQRRLLRLRGYSTNELDAELKRRRRPAHRPPKVNKALQAEIVAFCDRWVSEGMRQPACRVPCLPKGDGIVLKFTMIEAIETAAAVYDLSYRYVRALVYKKGP